jgi:cytochrome o ubiquinol oxidase subunit IV
MSHTDGGIEDGDTAPGDKHEAEGELGGGSIQSYVIGLALSTLLTVASFGLPATGLVWGPGVPVALAVLAIAQMGVHLVFFFISQPRPTTRTMCWRSPLVSWSSAF